MHVEFGVLGPVAAWDAGGVPIALRGPRHRAVLARLLIARGRMVPVSTLIDHLWDEPPANAAGVIQTFVSALRRGLEPDRRPRTPALLLVTEGRGYALRADAAAVDARRYEDTLTAARTAAPSDGVRLLEEADRWWRGPAYADFPDEPWARAERTRLTELRHGGSELRLRYLLDLGRTDDALAGLQAHTAGHPWREEGWRLLALALYRAGRQTEALDVLRRARSGLADEFGLDPGPELRRLEDDILRQAAHLELPAGGAGRVWTDAVATYGRTVTGDGRARLRSTVELLRSIAVTGGDGLVASREQRVASIRAAEELGDAALTARVIGAYDVPAVWSRSDDPAQAALVVAAAERTLDGLGTSGRSDDRARLLATIAIESRGVVGPRGRAAAEQAVEIARESGGAALLVFALNGLFLQSFHRAGLAAGRDAIGAELIELSTRHGLETFVVLGHLVRMQARAGLGDVAGADTHADAVDTLAAEYGSPLVGVFTTWYRALRTASTADPSAALAAYAGAGSTLVGAGMPGLTTGLTALAELSVRVRHGLPMGEDIDTGPYRPWTAPLVLLDRGDRDAALDALRSAPDPTPDHLLEVSWCLLARAAVTLDDRPSMERVRVALTPAAGESAGAGSGLISLGTVDDHLRPLHRGLANPD